MAPPKEVNSQPNFQLDKTFFEGVRLDPAPKPVSLGAETKLSVGGGGLKLLVNGGRQDDGVSQTGLNFYNEEIIARVKAQIDAQNRQDQVSRIVNLAVGAALLFLEICSD